MSLTALPFVADHRVEGRVIVPATAYLEMMLSAGAQSLGDGPLTLSEIQLEKALFLEPTAIYRLQLSLEYRSDDVAVVRIHGREASATGTDWILHVSGTVSRDRTAARVAAVDVDAIRRRCPTSVSGAEFYERLAERGNEWGPAFRGVTRLWHGDGEALSEIGVPAGIAAELESYLIHPAVADASGHVLAATIPLQKSAGEKGGAFVGGGIERITLHRRPGAGPLLAYAVRRPTPDGPSNILSGDVTVMDDAGVVAEVTGARLWYLADGAAAVPAGRGDDWLCAVEWRPTPRSRRSRSPRPVCDASSWPTARAWAMPSRTPSRPRATIRSSCTPALTPPTSPASWTRGSPTRTAPRGSSTCGASTDPRVPTPLPTAWQGPGASGPQACSGSPRRWPGSAVRRRGSGS